MAEFPYVDWLTQSYLERAENSGHWRDYLQAHGLANFCASREPTDRRCKLVYEIENSWHKGEHPLSYEAHKQLTEHHKQLLHDFRDQTRTEFAVLDTVGKSLDTDDIFNKQNLKDSLDFCEKIFASSQKCSEDFVTVSKQILESSVEVLKRGNWTAPCKFVVIGLGSIAKGEATPYSDLEYAFIVEREDEYFEKLAMDSYFRIGNLGETPLKTFDIPEFKGDDNSTILNSKDLTIGYRIDGITERAGNIPTGSGRDGGQPLTLTVQQFLEFYKASAESPSDGLADKSDLLSSSVPIYTNDDESDVGNLYRKFITARAVYEQSEASGNERVQQKRFDLFAADVAGYTFLPEFVKYQPPSNMNVKVKTDIFRYPTLLANNMKMCLGLNINQSREAYASLHQQGSLSAENFQYMTIILALSIYIRTAAYLTHKSQIDSVRVAPSTEVSADTTYEVPSNLFVILGCLLTPIKQSIKSSVDRLKDGRVASLQLSLYCILQKIKVSQRDYLLKTEVLYFTGRYESAIQALSSAIGRSLDSTSCSEFCKLIADIERSTQTNHSTLRRVVNGMIAKLIKQTVDSDFTKKYIQLANYLLYYTGHYKSALDYFNCNINTQDEQADFWKLLAAHCYKEIGDYITSMKLLQEVNYLMVRHESATAATAATTMHLMDEEFGTSQHQDISLSYRHIGIVYKNMCEYDESLKYHNRALAMDIAMYGDVSHSYIADSYNNIGIVYRHLGEYNTSLEYYTKSLDMRKAIFGADSNHTDIATSYNNIGEVYRLLGEYNTSLEYHIKALDIRKPIFGADSNHTDIADSYNNIGIVYRLLGEYNTSSEYHIKALDIRKAIFGADSTHTDIANSYSNIGIVYQLLGEYNTSLEYHTKSLDMRKAIFGADSTHTDIANSYNNIGIVYQLLGEYNTSLEYYTKSLDMNKAIFGANSNHPSVTRNQRDIDGLHRVMSEHT